MLSVYTDLKNKSCYDVNFFITGGTGICHNDSLIFWFQDVPLLIQTKILDL